MCLYRLTPVPPIPPPPSPPKPPHHNPPPTTLIQIEKRPNQHLVIVKKKRNHNAKNQDSRAPENGGKNEQMCEQVYALNRIQCEPKAPAEERKERRHSHSSDRNNDAHLNHHHHYHSHHHQINDRRAQGHQPHQQAHNVRPRDFVPANREIHAHGPVILNPVYHINDGRPAERDAIHEFAYQARQEQPREHHAPRVRQRRVRAEHGMRNVDFHPVAPVGYGDRERSREEHWSTEVQVSDSSGGNDEWDYDIVANRRGGAERVQPLPPRGQRPGEERVRFRDGIAVPREFGEGYGERRGAINGHLRFQEAGRRDEGEVRRIERLLAGVHLSEERGGGRARDGEVYGWDERWEY